MWLIDILDGIMQSIPEATSMEQMALGILCCKTESFRVYLAS